MYVSSISPQPKTKPKFPFRFIVIVVLTQGRGVVLGLYKAIKCKPYSEITVESGTQLITVHICSVYHIGCSSRNKWQKCKSLAFLSLIILASVGVLCLKKKVSNSRLRNSLIAPLYYEQQQNHIQRNRLTINGTSRMHSVEM